MLFVVHLAQLLFICCQLPFNERIENVIQGFVTFQQTLFFVLLAVSISGESSAGPGQAQHLGPVMNFINLAAVAILVMQAMKSQIFTMRKLILKAKKNLAQGCGQAVSCVMDRTGCVQTCIYGPTKA